MKFAWSRREFLAASTIATLPRIGAGAVPPASLKDGWAAPTRSYRPHTRWWWPGNAVSQAGITWQLEQMRRQGMGGVEIMSSWGWYAKGDIPYLSERWCDMVRHAMHEAARLDLDVALTFGPGWSFGGFWVPVEDRSKALAPAWQDAGPGSFDAELPLYQGPRQDLGWTAPDENRIVAVVAGRLDGETLIGDSLVDLTDRVEGNRLRWTAPDGRWRIMNFRIRYTGQQNQAQNSLPKNWTVDHLNKAAMTRYCDYLGGAFQKAFGPYFGKTIDTYFCDSFEIQCPPNTLLWSADTLAGFRQHRGYDLTRYLPAVWFDIGELTPRIRYDVNEYLHQVGLEATFKTFIDRAAASDVQARIQPHYRFTEEIIQGAGMTPRPEMEVTTARFETIADPRKAIAAGAHFYGREIVSAESYTFLHQERYRTSLEEMKRATDAFLRDGVTQFYNHGFVYTEEKDVAPSRDMPWANRISPWNTWWRYYHHLTAYIARAAFLCRQGSFAGDVLLYSPQSSVWSQTGLFGFHRRIMPYGSVPKTLVANGYDYDPVNDDVLQNHARFENGYAHVRDLSYRFVVMPAIAAMPLATLEALRRFVLAGGIVIALDSLPAAGVGLKDHARQDARAKELVAELFGTDRQGRAHPGGGRTYFIPDYKIPDFQTAERAFSPSERPWAPTPPLAPPQKALLDAMRAHLHPDFALEGARQSDGLTFLHRKACDADIYFVTNLQPNPSRTPVTFRVSGKRLECWDAITGKVAPAPEWRAVEGGTRVPVDLGPWASLFFVFTPGQSERPRAPKIESSQPNVLDIAGTWDLALEGVRFPAMRKRVARLASWTEDPETKHFSGTGTYDLEFEIPAAFLTGKPEIVLDLGSVGSVAEVRVNGKEAGVCWMQPYRLAVTSLVTPGRNRLTVAVTGLLINHVSGLKTLPGVPPELVPRFGETTDRYRNGAQTFRRERGFEPLPPSGLIGPVRLLATRSEA